MIYLLTFLFSLQSAFAAGSLLERWLDYADFNGPLTKVGITAYCPLAASEMKSKATKTLSKTLEGGRTNSHSEPATRIEDAIATGQLFSIAADGDLSGEFAKRCNSAKNRCLVLGKMANFNTLYPGYAEKFCLPKDYFVAIVEDSGDAFEGTDGRRFDIATTNGSYCRGTEKSGWGLSTKIPFPYENDEVNFDGDAFDAANLKVLKRVQKNTIVGAYRTFFVKGYKPEVLRWIDFSQVTCNKKYVKELVDGLKKKKKI